MATFTIDLFTGKLFLFTGDFTGSGSTPTSGSTYPQVNYYASLPTPVSASGEVYLVRNGSGTTVLDRKPAGLYFSTGTEWRYLGDTPDAFKSENFQILDSNDLTKGVMFETSGITTGTNSVLTIQNSDGTIAYLTDLDTKVDVSVFDNYTGTTAPNTFVNWTTFTGYTATTNTAIANIELKTDLFYTGETHTTSDIPTMWMDGTWGASSLQLSTGVTDHFEHNTGHLHWTPDEGTASLSLLKNVNLQLGEETLVYGIAIETLTDGDVVSSYGFTSGGTILLGKADIQLRGDNKYTGNDLGIMTSSAVSGETAYAALFGKVRDVNTSMWSGGTSLWLSNTVRGALTAVEPVYPEEKIGMAFVAKVGVSDGELLINPSLDLSPQINNLEYYDDYFVGTFIDKVNQIVYETGGTVYITIEKDVVSGSTDFRILVGTDNIIIFSAQTIALNAGTDNIPILNYVSMTTSGIQVQTGWFTGNQLDLDGVFSAVATVLCQSPSGVSTSGVYKHHGWIDRLSTITRGDNVKVAERLRQENAKYTGDGCVQTFLLTPNGAGLDRIDISTTQAVIYQKNRNTFPILTTVGDTNAIWVANLDAGGYLEETDIGKMNFTTDGVVLGNNRWVSVVVWGVVSQNTSDCKYFANVSTGSYGSLALATNDPNNYSVYTVSDDFKGTAFLISRVILKYQTLSSGTWTIESSIDLRGVDIGTVSGVIGGGGTIAVKNSIEQDVDLIYQLVGDELTPDANKFYGVTGTSKGWYEIPSDNTKADKLITINDITGTTYTVITDDSNEILEASNVGATTITLPTGLTTGFQVTVINIGAQTITFSAGTGASLRSKDSAVTLTSQYGVVSAYLNGTAWTLTGDLI